MLDRLSHGAARLLAFIDQAGPDKRGAVRQAWWLWVGLFLLGILLVLMVAAIGRRRRRATEGSRPPARPIKDAWEEAGKRAEPLPERDLEDQA